MLGINITGWSRVARSLKITILSPHQPLRSHSLVVGLSITVLLHRVARYWRLDLRGGVKWCVGRDEVVRVQGIDDEIED